MRAWWIVALLLAGCSQSPDAGMESAVHSGGPTPIHLLGDPSPGGDQVVIGSCGEEDNVRAYRLEAEETLRLATPLKPPRPGSFLLASFEQTEEGLYIKQAYQGGQDLRLSHGTELRTWSRELPREMTFEATDGHVLLVVACTGTESINYVVDGSPDRRPRSVQYAEGTVASGFENLLGFITDHLHVSAALTLHKESYMGLEASYSQAAPGGVRVGSTVFEWSTDGAGWSTVECSAQGMGSLGSWGYAGNLHAGEVNADGYLVRSTWASFAPDAEDVFGTAHVAHTAEGDQPGSFRFEVKHDGSLVISQALCTGLHLGTSLDSLFGGPARTGMAASEGLVGA